MARVIQEAKNNSIPLSSVESMIKKIVSFYFFISLYMVHVPLCTCNLLQFFWQAFIFFVKRVIFALLCAAAQQSYCRHAGIRHPSSVDIVFSGAMQWINVKFGDIHLSTISPDHFFFCFSKLNFLIFYDFFWRKKLEKKISNNISSESAHHIHSNKIMHTSRKGLYQICSKNCEISNFANF